MNFFSLTTYGSLTTTSFDGNKREDLNLIAMRFAAENLGVWKKWCEYLYQKTDWKKMIS